MALFSVNYEAAEQFSSIEDGTYEVVVVQAEQARWNGFLRHSFKNS